MLYVHLVMFDNDLDLPFLPPGISTLVYYMFDEMELCLYFSSTTHVSIHTPRFGVAPA